MKKKELLSQIQELNRQIEILKEYVYSLGAENPAPEPYYTKISKHEAYHLALEYYKIQPDQHTTLGSFLSKVDEIIEWHNNQEVLPVQ